MTHQVSSGAARGRALPGPGLTSLAHTSALAGRQACVSVVTEASVPRGRVTALGVESWLGAQWGREVTRGLLARGAVGTQPRAATSQREPEGPWVVVWPSWILGREYV